MKKAKKNKYKKMKSTQDKKRMNVFKSNDHIYVQIIDDQDGKTIVSASSLKLKPEKKSVMAQKVGMLIAKKAKEKKIKHVKFDRGRCRYTGRVKELANSARSEGLSF